MSEFLFDFKLNAALRVNAPDENKARTLIAHIFDAADCNAGSFEDGSPVLFEASINDNPLILAEVDGETPEGSGGIDMATWLPDDVYEACHAFDVAQDGDSGDAENDAACTMRDMARNLASRYEDLQASHKALKDALDYVLEQTVDSDLAYGIALTEGESEAREKALVAIARAAELMGSEPATKPKFRLWELRAGDEVNNFDLFVIAADHNEAAAVWRAYYDEDDSAYPREARSILPAHGPARAVDWQDMTGFKWEA